MYIIYIYIYIGHNRVSSGSPTELIRLHYLMFIDACEMYLLIVKRKLFKKYKIIYEKCII